MVITPYSTYPAYEQRQNGCAGIVNPEVYILKTLPSIPEQIGQASGSAIHIILSTSAALNASTPAIHCALATSVIAILSAARFFMPYSSRTIRLMDAAAFRGCSPRINARSIVLLILFRSSFWFAQMRSLNVAPDTSDSKTDRANVSSCERDGTVIPSMPA